MELSPNKALKAAAASTSPKELASIISSRENPASDCNRPENIAKQQAIQLSLLQAGCCNGSSGANK
jgi:hypothetical protein